MASASFHLHQLTSSAATHHQLPKMAGCCCRWSSASAGWPVQQADSIVIFHVLLLLLRLAPACLLPLPLLRLLLLFLYLLRSHCWASSNCSCHTAGSTAAAAYNCCHRSRRHLVGCFRKQLPGIKSSGASSVGWLASVGCRPKTLLGYCVDHTAMRRILANHELVNSAISFLTAEALIIALEGTYIMQPLVEHK
jgi:hypothetical protein